MATTNSEQFTIDIVGEVSEQTWKGLFKTKIRLSHRDHLRQDEIRRDLIGPQPPGVSPGPRAGNTADLLSFIQIHLLESPQWWTMNGNGLDFEDDNVISEVYGKIVDLKVKATDKAKTKADEDKVALTKAAEVEKK